MSKRDEQTQALGGKGSDDFERFCALLWDGMRGAAMGLSPKWADLPDWPQADFRATVRNAFARSAEKVPAGQARRHLLYDFADMVPPA